MRLPQAGLAGDPGSPTFALRLRTTLDRPAPKNLPGRVENAERVACFGNREHLQEGTRRDDGGFQIKRLKLAFMADQVGGPVRFRLKGLEEVRATWSPPALR